MSEIHNQREIELLEAQLRECRSENAKLRTALERIAELPVGYADMNPDHVIEVLTHKARTALGGEND